MEFTSNTDCVELKGLNCPKLTIFWYLLGIELTSNTDKLLLNGLNCPKFTMF